MPSCCVVAFGAKRRLVCCSLFDARRTPRMRRPLVDTRQIPKGALVLKERRMLYTPVLTT
jgi:hypothetical protein